MRGNRSLNKAFIEKTKKKIEDAVIPVMEKTYLHDRDIFDDSFQPELKYIERIECYYDYFATGFSVLAILAGRGDDRAKVLIEKIRKNIEYYRKNVYGKELPEGGLWQIPVRRMILHIALAYRNMEHILSEEEKTWFRNLVEEEVPLVIEHCKHFYPGLKDVHLEQINNHDALFMQGIYWCGKIFDRPEWVEQMLEFAERYFASGHPDGYFEEHTNEAREGGPSLVYSCLTAGALYDVLDGKNHPREKFLKCGQLYRKFCTNDYEFIPFADERTNVADMRCGYGMALQSMTPEGRQAIIDMVEATDFYNVRSAEALAVPYHELELMTEGPCAVPENKREGGVRIALPLGVLRKNGFTAGISALRALNHILRPEGDYALDHQNMIYLYHKKGGVISSGVKSKRDPLFSTFRVGKDAYTVRTGELEMGDNFAEARLYYQTFEATIRWKIGETAVLSLSSESNKEISSTILVTDEKFIKTQAPYKVRMLPGFSPYTQGNKAEARQALIFRWKGKLVVEFDLGT